MKTLEELQAELDAAIAARDCCDARWLAAGVAWSAADKAVRTARAIYNRKLKEIEDGKDN